MKQENIDAIKATIKTQFNHRLNASERKYTLDNFSLTMQRAACGIKSLELKEATLALGIDKKYTEEEALEALFKLISIMKLINAYNEVTTRRAQLYNACLFFEKMAGSFPRF